MVRAHSCLFNESHSNSGAIFNHPDIVKALRFHMGDINLNDPRVVDRNNDGAVADLMDPVSEIFDDGVIDNALLLHVGFSFCFGKGVVKGADLRCYS